jgi:MoxR-like ATPase
MAENMRTPNYTVEAQQKFIDSLIEEFGDTCTSKQILDYAEGKGLPVPYFLLRDEKKKYGRGKYRLCSRVALLKKNTVSHAIAAALDKADAQAVAPAMAAGQPNASNPIVQIATRRALNVTESFVPDRLETYVPFGFFNDLRDIINSKIFYPVYITGHSGNGKTLMVEQVCSSLGRECVRVNITKRTDETDLIGSYELIDGSTIRREGPVVTAMRRGAILLLDEVDLGTEDLLCLQPILEGKPYFDKKTGEVIHPVLGFNIIATANTKGKGDADGRYLGANVMNEAMLERFALTEEQEYPDAKTEKKILSKNFAMLEISDDDFIDRLIQWAEVIRKSFADGAVDELITTRRLVHIAKAYKIFKKNRIKAIEKCLNRFDAETKTAFLDLYTKVDADAHKVEAETKMPNAKEFSDMIALLSGKYGTPVAITKNENTKCYILDAFNRKTQISYEMVAQAQSVTGIFDATISNHKFLKDST